MGTLVMLSPCRLSALPLGRFPQLAYGALQNADLRLWPVGHLSAHSPRSLFMLCELCSVSCRGEALEVPDSQHVRIIHVTIQPHLGQSAMLYNTDTETIQQIGSTQKISRLHGNSAAAGIRWRLVPSAAENEGRALLLQPKADALDGCRDECGHRRRGRIPACAAYETLIETHPLISVALYPQQC